jgi:hypothetical protein
MMAMPACTGCKSVSIATALACLLLLAFIVNAQPSPPNLSVDSDIATAGFYRLSWEPPAGQVELQESADPVFRDPATRYVGHDSATLISGKPDGQWYYRVRALSDTHTGDWSNTVAITVNHHSLVRAVLFLSLGIIVFITIVLLVIRGPGRQQ